MARLSGIVGSLSYCILCVHPCRLDPSMRLSKNTHDRRPFKSPGRAQSRADLCKVNWRETQEETGLCGPSRYRMSHSPADLGMQLLHCILLPSFRIEAIWTGARANSLVFERPSDTRPARLGRQLYRRKHTQEHAYPTIFNECRQVRSWCWRASWMDSHLISLSPMSATPPSERCQSGVTSCVTDLAVSDNSSANFRGDFVAIERCKDEQVHRVALARFAVACTLCSPKSTGIEGICGAALSPPVRIQASSMTIILRACVGSGVGECETLKTPPAARANPRVVYMADSAAILSGLPSRRRKKAVNQSPYSA
ncbi:hypothetical protein BDW66DRAFT_121373 [Aspergillus desertorum]